MLETIKQEISILRYFKMKPNYSDLERRYGYFGKLLLNIIMDFKRSRLEKKA